MLTLAASVIEKFGGDTMDDVRASVERYRERIAGAPEAPLAGASRHGLVGTDEASSGGDD
jgi:hypothetical protein